MKSLMVTLFTAVIITGCVDRISEPRGTEIEVFPVTYQLKLRSDQPELVARKVNEFILDYPKNVKAAQWQIHTKGNGSQALYKEVVSQLIQAGVMSSQIEYSQIGYSPNEHNSNASDPLPLESRFDLSLSVTTYKTKLEICHQERVGEYGNGSLGCNVDTSRWQSMVNPHKAI
ncbi:hypothetical protein AB4232_04110 [Vibrio sp. 10N.286.46.A8]|uniref:hypothetical protein n=1 Tax=Vibrio sp. 10N.286.46.A8 TaxID=3229697 RepID=UPI00354D87D2